MYPRRRTEQVTVEVSARLPQPGLSLHLDPVECAVLVIAPENCLVDGELRERRPSLLIGTQDQQREPKESVERCFNLVLDTVGICNLVKVGDERHQRLAHTLDKLGPIAWSWSSIGHRRRRSRWASGSLQARANAWAETTLGSYIATLPDQWFKFTLPTGQVTKPSAVKDNCLHGLAYAVVALTSFDFASESHLRALYVPANPIASLGQVLALAEQGGGAPSQ